MAAEEESVSKRPPNARTVNRRGFLKVAGAGVVAALVHSRVPSALAALDPTLPWSDPRAWGGRVPGPQDVALVTRPVRLDRNVRVAGVVVTPTGSLVFDPNLSVTLESTGNVIVRGGRLAMRPSGVQVVHRITFVDVNESRYVGGGMDPKDTDVGLWIQDGGVLDLVGTHRLPWARAAAIRRGATSITLEAAPEGWQVGDEIILTPTLSITAKNAHAAYDVNRVTGIVGNVVKLASPVNYDHPVVSVGRGKSLGCEVLNLTRNVVVGGTPTGRAHVMFTGNSGRQNISCVRIEHIGPQKYQGKIGRDRLPLREPVLGRYGFHFHMAGDTSRGSVVQGLVVTKCGSHAFVLHNSNGITLRQCVAHDTATSQFWWDTEGDAGLQSIDNLYEGCVGSSLQVLNHPDYQYRQGSFELQRGMNNAAVGCVAVGNNGIDSSAGYVWNTISVGTGVWRFLNNVSHNQRATGSFVWQNSSGRHVIDGLVSYHNGGPGITHGAYRNGYVYRNCISYGNRSYPLKLHASSREDIQERFEDCLFDGAGRVEYAVAAPGNATLPAQAPTLFLRCDFRGYSRAGMGNIATKSGEVMLIDLVDCTYGANEFLFGPNTHRDTRWRVQDVKHGSIMLMPRGSGGRYTAAWDAEVKQIAPFVVAPASAPAPASQEPLQSAFACRL
jgi:hypothetical protein